LNDQGFATLCFPPFQISFFMSICSRFVSVSLQYHTMGAEGAFRAGFFVHHCITDNLLASSHCVRSSFWCLWSLSWLWSSFPIFLVVLVRVFLLSMLSSPVEDMFWCGQFLCSVLLLLRRRLLRFQVSLRHLEPIVMLYWWMLDRSVFGSIEFLGSWIFFCRRLLLLCCVSW
jgi:hypothetical protein